MGGAVLAVGTLEPVALAPWVDETSMGRVRTCSQRRACQRLSGGEIVLGKSQVWYQLRREQAYKVLTI